ncbi:MAG TPA: hypothetical protein DCQ31_03350, partial [Bacteroidales bacterium]|nr:hypothetical protein [Bacteroidales bacterium]
SEAAENLEAAAIIATANNYTDLHINILIELIKCYHTGKQFEKSSKYAEELIIAQTAQTENKSLAKFSESLFDYDMLKSKQTIEQLEKEQTTHEQQLAKQKIIISFFIITSIIGIIIFLIVRKLRKQRSAAYQMLKKHTEELLMKRIELQKVKQKLELGNSYFIDIINNIPIMILAFDSEGNIACWNKQAEKLTGWDAKTLLNKKSINSLIPKYSDLNFSDLISKIKSKQHETITMLCKDGSYKLLSITAITHKPPISNWEHWMLAIDLTENLKFQTALAREKSLLDSMINTIPDIIYYKDLNGKYLGYNKAFAKFRNFSKNFAIGKVEEEISDQSIAAISTQKDISIIQKEKIIVEKQHITTADGKDVIFLVHKLPFYDQSKNVLGMLAIGRDITDQENYEKTLKEARARAEESDRLKSAFLANMSHEIRTPLNAIVGFSELLSYAEESVDDRRNYIQYITSSAQDLIRLVNDIIDFAKIESGQLDIHQQSISPTELLTEINQIYLSILQQKTVKHIELKFVPQSNAFNFKFLIDPYRLKQIISNLINNALKFTDTGFIEFGWYFPDSQTIMFYVKDTGVGIPADKQNFIFSRFSQIKDTLDRNVGGTGLGLAITKQLTELMQGNIYVESEENVGSLFYISFPLHPNESAAGYFDWNAVNLGKNFNILYISEFAHTYESIVSMLHLAGINTIFAGTPEHAISILKKNTIDFIINNLNTTNTAILETKLAENNFTQKIIKPILYKEFSCSKCTCIVKPFKTEELLIAIQNIA